MNSNDGALDFEVLMNNDKFKASMDESIRRIQGLSKTTVTEGKKMDGAFNKIGEIVGGLIGPVSALTAAYKFQQLAQEALEFERAFGMAMREVQTISTAVQEDFEGISEAIVNMSANGPDGAIKLAKAYYQIVSAGYDGAAGLKLLDVSSKAATAGVTETAVAADGLTTVLNAWGLSADKAGAVADVMFKTVERGKTTFGELASSIAQVAPLASANNIAFEEIFAALQTVTKQGTPTAQAMTQIRSAIINMNNVLGDGWSNTMTFQEGLEKIAKQAGGSQTALKALIPDVEAISGVLALTGEKAKGAAEDLDATTKAAGAMQKAYGAMMEEADNKWSVVHNKWTREVRTLGTAMKSGSSGFADFLNDLLTNEKTDIIDPAAKKIVDDTAASVDKLTTKEEKLAAVIAKINELQAKRVKELNPEATKLEKQQPGGLARGIETLNAGLGLSTAFTPFRVKQTELAMYNKEIAITQQAEKDLFALFTQISNSVESGSDGTVKAVRTLKDINDEIAAAKKTQEGSSNKTEYNNIQKTIDKLEAEKAAIAGVKKAVDDLKKAQEDLENAIKSGDQTTINAASKRLTDLEQEKKKLEEIIELQMQRAWRSQFDGQSMAEIPTIGVKPIVQVGSQKTAIDGYGKTVLYEVTAIDKTGPTWKKVKAQIKGLKDYSDALAEEGAEEQEEADEKAAEKKLRLQEELINGAARFTNELINQLDVSDKVKQAMSDMVDVAANLASGNYIAAGFSAATALIPDVFTEQERLEQAAQSVLDLYKLQNFELERQLGILGQSTGSGRVDEEKKTLELIERQKKELEDAAMILQVDAKKTESSGWFGWGSKTTTMTYTEHSQYDTIEKWRDTLEYLKTLTTQGWTIEGADDVIALIDEYETLIAQRQALLEELTGTTSSGITDVIANGFAAGKDSIADFADDFESMMKAAVINVFKTQYLANASKGFFDQFATLSENGLTETEIGELRVSWSDLIAGSKAKMDELSAISGLDFSGTDTPSSTAQSGMKGISASASEDTVSAMVGQTMALRNDFKVSQDLHRVQVEQGLNQTAILTDSLFQLQGIKKNTDNLGRLENIERGIDTINDTLKKGLSV